MNHKDFSRTIVEECYAKKKELLIPPAFTLKLSACDPYCGLLDCNVFYCIYVCMYVFIYVAGCIYVFVYTGCVFREKRGRREK